MVPTMITTSAPSTAAPSPPASKNNGSSGPSSAGIVILVVVIVAIVVAIGVCVYKRCGAPSSRSGDIYQPPPYDNDAEMHRNNVAVAEIN